VLVLAVVLLVKWWSSPHRPWGKNSSLVASPGFVDVCVVVILCVYLPTRIFPANLGQAIVYPGTNPFHIPGNIMFDQAGKFYVPTLRRGGGGGFTRIARNGSISCV